jgi:hypothetical protein
MLADAQILIAVPRSMAKTIASEITFDLPALAEEIIAAIRREVPAYARPLEGAFGAAVRRGVEEALARFEDPAPRRAARRVYVELGRGEAREGRSLDALLAAYRVGARVAWRHMGAAGVAAGVSPERLVTLADAIFTYIDQLSAESAEGHAQESARRAGELERGRAELVELLVSDPPPDEAAVASRATAVGWEPPRELAALVWHEAHGRRPERRLPHGSIVGAFDGQVVALVPAPVRRAALERAVGAIPAALGPAVPLLDAGRSHRRAAAGLALARAGLLVTDQHRAGLLVRTDAALVEEIAAERLGPLAEETPASRSRLEATLLAWLRRDGDVPAAAADLHVHAQTVRYRLARLRELLGDALDDPDARFELEAALRAKQIDSAVTSGA